MSPDARLVVLTLAAFHWTCAAWKLLERNCWPDFPPNYALCCKAVPSVPGTPPAQCFDKTKTFERCCECPHSDDTSLGDLLTEHFFGPLLCSSSVKTHDDDFWIVHQGHRRLLKVYIYPLERKFNADILHRLQLGGWVDGSDCDYGLTPCTESQWNGLFSVYRQFATEILILLKFLAAPKGVLTEDPHEADLFVVPYFAKTDCAESGNAGRDPCWGNCKCARAVQHLFPALPHFSWQTRGRHLFLATGDIKDLPVEIQSQPLLVSLGASFCGGHVVVPSPNLDPDLQPNDKMEIREATGQSPERHILAFWFGSVHNTWRNRVVSQMQKYQESDAHKTKPVMIHGIDSNYVTRDLWQTTANSPHMVLEEMMRSQFCPVVQGDVPHQKRFFDAILTGCLPVVVTFKSHVKGYVSWWLPGGPPVERMVPFWDAIDYRSFVVEVPQSQVKAGGFMQRLLQIKPLELQRRQEAMRHARSLIRFDFSGAKPDAFTQVVQESLSTNDQLCAALSILKNPLVEILRAKWIWKFISALGGQSNCHGKGMAVPSNATLFDCGVPPFVREAYMYGVMACCPV